MESKYKERARKLVNQHILRLLAPNSDFAGGIVELMCQLAEEVENGLLAQIEDDIKSKIYSTQEVEELLQKQRELSLAKLRLELSTAPIPIPDYWWGEILLNAKLKID